MRLLLLKLLLTKRLKTKLKLLQKQLKRRERNLLKETLLLINRKCKRLGLLSIKNSEMFGIPDQLVFLTSNSLCVTTNQQMFLSLRYSRKLLLLTLRFLPKQLKDITEMKTEEVKPPKTIKLLVLHKIQELLNLLRKLLLTSMLILLTLKNLICSSMFFLLEVLIILNGLKTKLKHSTVKNLLSAISNLKIFIKKLTVLLQKQAQWLALKLKRL